MKTNDILVQRDRIAAKIARQFVDEALKHYVAEDAEKGIEKMITRFVNDLRSNVKSELRFRLMPKP